MTPNQSELKTTVEKLAAALWRLDAGALAELRRMDVNGPPVPIFWQLTAGMAIAPAQTAAWKQIVKLFALWVPRGERDASPKLNDYKNSLGKTFCDGAQAGWPGRTAPQAVLSETRLARFLSLPAARRGAALERIIRLLIHRRGDEAGINCVEIAALLLARDDRDQLDGIARAYYRRLDAAQPTPATPPSEGTDQ